MSRLVLTLALLPWLSNAQGPAPGTILTVAGSGDSSYKGDGAAATAAGMQPYGVAVDASGNLFIADYSDSRVRKVTQGVISTFAGCDPNDPACVLAEPGDLFAATSVVIGVSNISVDPASATSTSPTMFTNACAAGQLPGAHAHQHRGHRPDPAALQRARDPLPTLRSTIPAASSPTAPATSTSPTPATTACLR